MHQPANSSRNTSDAFESQNRQLMQDNIEMHKIIEMLKSELENNENQLRIENAELLELVEKSKVEALQVIQSNENLS